MRTPDRLEVMSQLTSERSRFRFISKEQQKRSAFVSVKIMSLVFERYPNGGGEMLLALALADHAHDDGTRIFPSVATLASKTRQSRRTVQNQLHKMVDEGWLIPVANLKGGRNKAVEYHIQRGWIKGADFAPIEEKGAVDDKKGCNQRQERVQPVAPEPSLTINKPSKSVTLTPALMVFELPGLSPEVAQEYLDHRKALRKPLSAGAWRSIAGEVRKAIGFSPSAALREAMAAGWVGLRADWLERRSKPLGKQEVTYAERFAQEFSNTEWADTIPAGVQVHENTRPLQ